MLALKVLSSISNQIIYTTLLMFKNIFGFLNISVSLNRLPKVPNPILQYMLRFADDAAFVIIFTVLIKMKMAE